jgi:hypothetical protein
MTSESLEEIASESLEEISIVPAPVEQNDVHAGKMDMNAVSTFLETMDKPASMNSLTEETIYTKASALVKEIGIKVQPAPKAVIDRNVVKKEHVQIVV